jgi:pimeloyl-ACP methyl ester carboxylesterase
LQCNCDWASRLGSLLNGVATDALFHLVPVARANTRDLSTGSHIAYSVYEPSAGVPVKTDPIVSLHGGPGIRATDYDHRFYSQFARDGFRVYLFDQAGSGLSYRLPHATD